MKRKLSLSFAMALSRHLGQERIFMELFGEVNEVNLEKLEAESEVNSSETY